jgi:hypothetical protein
MSLNLNHKYIVSSEGHKKIITPSSRLKRRIKKEFPQKVLIGDIIINEQEYELLVEYFKVKCTNILRSSRPILDDPVFATSLVQIGIKNYDGNLWGHIARILGVDKINANHQGRIGESFVSILQLYKKIMLDKSERVNNILMHGFVSDYYANEMFDFLFKYYNLDLERDLARNTTDMMNSLMDIAQRSDNTGRTYLLVKQTANALSINSKGGKIRLRRLLRMIDRCFWEQIKPANPVSRLSILFNKWSENSVEFQSQYYKFHASAKHAGGKKSYSSPYLICDFHRTTFKLVLPTQLIKFEHENNLAWSVQIGDQYTQTVRTNTYAAVTGYKTDEQDIALRTEDLFNSFQVELTSNGERVKVYKIKSDCIRFFDKSGVYLLADSNLPKGEVYAFTPPFETPRSEALIENELVNGLVRSYFEFEYGDIVRLPDGNAISIGKKMEEGLLNRKLVQGANGIMGDLSLPIYAGSPTILLKIASKRANGTMIVINDQRYRIFDQEVTVVDLDDRTGEMGYILNLNHFECTASGIYHCYIDVPNDRTNRSWSFALLNDFSYQFEDAPYIFHSRGTIGFHDGVKLEPKDKSFQKNSDQNSYNFTIDPKIDEISFIHRLKDTELLIRFLVPALRWKFDNGSWNVEKPSDIWHGDMPNMIYIKYRDDKLKFSMDEDFLEEEMDYSLLFQKSKNNNLFECDMTRVRSWLGREKVLRIGYLDLPNNRTEFLRLITRSVAISCLLKVDYESDELHGSLNIVGKSNYFVDMINLDTNEYIAQKLPVTNGEFTMNHTSGSGRYKVNVFEDDEDDTGFGIINYMLVESFEQTLTNPYDLSGRSIALRYIKKGRASMFQMGLGCKYAIRNLQRNPEDDRRTYKGKLSISNAKLQSPIHYDVTVNFPELDKLQYAYISFFDGYDDVEFLYDNQQNHLVKAEQKDLTRAVRYRRYESLFPEDYVYLVDFID